MGTDSYQLTGQEHATVLAALRYYQLMGLADDPQLRPDAIHDIATGGDNAGFIASLDGNGIDQLCERLNTEDGTSAAKQRRRIADALRLAIARGGRDLRRWPERKLDNPEHRALRAALGKYQHALDSLTGGAS